MCTARAGTTIDPLILLGTGLQGPVLFFRWKRNDPAKCDHRFGPVFHIIFMRTTLLAAVIGTALDAFAQADSTSRTPFEGYDLTWINGQNRQREFPLTLLDTATGQPLVTGVAYLDTYFNYNFADPIDNTQTISATTGRHKEFTLNLASIGVETNYRNTIGRLWLQFGQMQEIVQKTDGTVLRGRNTSTDGLRYIREAAAGYHFDHWHGINVEMGIFMSYIGLESYLTQENWSYQRSMVCDFTPFYFSGARVQAFPSRKYRTELWLLNGWQSYNTWNTSLGVGNSNYYRPTEDLQLVANFYYGNDSRAGSVMRFHHDNSIVYRYLRGRAKGITQAAFSLNSHYGFQSGEGVDPADNHMIGASLAHRTWFHGNKLALTLRADQVANPGLYLAFSPSPVAPNDFTDAVAQGKDLSITQLCATFDVMPSDFFTFRVEYAHRSSSVPYFPGPGGTTSPDGWSDTPTGTWRPDLRTTEDRIILALNFRL